MNRDSQRTRGRGGGYLAGALVAVSAPIVLAPLLSPDVRRAPEFAEISAIVAYVGVLAADLLIYLHWRMTDGPASWLVLAITAIATQSLALAGLVAAYPDESSSHPGWILLMQIILALGVFAMAVAAGEHRLSIDPILAGTVLGVAVAVVRSLLVNHTEPLELSSSALRFLVAATLAVDLAIAVALFRITVAPLWIRVRLGCAMVLLGIGHVAAYPVPRGVLLSIATVATNIVAAAILLSLGLVLVRASWLDNRAALDLLGLRLEQVEADARVEKARLHEIRATVAGLGTASRLVHERSAISPTRRRQIEAMMDSEMSRLQRLLNDGDTAAPEPVDIDATIDPIVTRHRALGYPIRWTPTGQRAIARADDVAEVVNVLLQNAVQHAPGAGATISTSAGHGIVEIAVSDSGPGVDQAIRSKVFDWGERGRHSGGSGIGLNVARRLTVDLGGYLRLVESTNPGATFVLGLPSEELP